MQALGLVVVVEVAGGLHVEWSGHQCFWVVGIVAVGECSWGCLLRAVTAVRVLDAVGVASVIASQEVHHSLPSDGSDGLGCAVGAALAGAVSGDTPANNAVQVGPFVLVGTRGSVQEVVDEGMVQKNRA